MLLTFIRSEYWPKTAEGKLLCLLLSVYGFAVFGYMTASLASFFVGRDAQDEKPELAGGHSIAGLRAHLEEINREIHKISHKV